MLAENLVEPYKQSQNNPSKNLAIESKSNEEREEERPPELNACELYPNNSPDTVAADLESGNLDMDEDYDLKSEDEFVSFNYCLLIFTLPLLGN